jgi:hypothetical protein
MSALSPTQEEFDQASPYLVQPETPAIETVTADPDREWTVWSNPDYAHNKWMSTPDSAFEKRCARDSPLDSWSGLNYDKIPTEVGEYYSASGSHAVQYWDEDAYYRTVTADKTDEQVAEEVDAPRQAMFSKIADYEEKGQQVIWTPTMAAMAQPAYSQMARALEYEVSPHFQLNSQGFRKNLTNIRVAEYRPFFRLTRTSWSTMLSDYLLRFQIYRWNLTCKGRLRYMRFVVGGGLGGMFIDHFYARQYRRSYKWH